MQDAIWILPAIPRNQECFQWLASEIIELKGEAVVFQSQLLLQSEGPSLQAQFEENTVAAYQDILSALKRKNPDLADLSKKFQQAKEWDFFQSDLGEQVRKKLLAAPGGQS